jgi:hypothetical protein
VLDGNVVIGRYDVEDNIGVIYPLDERDIEYCKRSWIEYV